MTGTCLSAPSASAPAPRHVRRALRMPSSARAAGGASAGGRAGSQHTPTSGGARHQESQQCEHRCQVGAPHDATARKKAALAAVLSGVDM